MFIQLVKYNSALHHYVCFDSIQKRKTQKGTYFIASSFLDFSYSTPDWSSSAVASESFNMGAVPSERSFPAESITSEVVCDINSRNLNLLLKIKKMVKFA